MYESIVKKNRIEILKKLGISSLEFSTEVFNSLMLHYDGLISFWVDKKISSGDIRYDNTTLIRYENKGWRYCIGYLEEYDNFKKWTFMRLS